MTLDDPCPPARESSAVPRLLRTGRFFRIGAYIGFSFPLVLACLRYITYHVDRWMNPLPPGTAESGTWILGLIALVIGGPPLFSLLFGFLGWVLGVLLNRL